MKKTYKSALSLILCAAFVLPLVQFEAAAEEEASSSITSNLFNTANRENVYTNYYNRHKNAAKPDTEIVIEAGGYVSLAEDRETGEMPQVSVTDYEGEDDTLYWHNNEGEVTYSFSVAETGLYHLEMLYHPTTGEDIVSGQTASNVIEMGVLIDGDYPFLAAKTFSLDRYWTDSSSIRKDSKDNDLRPVQTQLDTWVTYPIKDKEGLFNEPYYFYLEAGEHTLTLRGIKVIAAIKSLTFKNYDAPVAYSAIKPTESELTATPALTTKNELGSTTIFMQGENSAYKTDSTLYATYDRTSYLTNPSHPTKQRYNTIGAETWQKATQAITWEFSVPNDGYYRFTAKVRQNIMRGFFSNRKILIDGEVPCEEFLQQKFKYDPNWYMQNFVDENGEDIYIYLTAGKHTLTLEAIPGEVGEIMQRLDELVYTLNYYYRRILMITGPNPDEFNDYYVDRQIPELIDVFEDAIAQLYAERDQIEALSGRAGSGASSLVTLAVILQRCVDKKDDIPIMLSTIRETIISVSGWMRDYRDQPLEIDYLEVGTAHEEFSNTDSNFFTQLAFDFNAFIGSFFEDYTMLSDDGTSKSLNVWVSQGRDQAVVVKELVDGDFNVNNSYGVSAAVNLVQGSILEATLADKGPEIALFIGGDFPVQLAARNLLVDLTEFKDYRQIYSERFVENAEVLYTYQDGVYGLPVSQSFPMMFYRTDILEEIGLEPPETWKDMIDMIPALQRQYLEIGLLNPSTNMSSSVFESGDTFTMLVLQTGLNFYTDDLSKTTYDNQTIIDAFTTWTKFYTIYNFIQIYDPFTRFRTGEMPIVINNYTFYNQLSVSAPEIKGLWDFTLVPGTMREDGTISHAASSGGSGAIIFTKTKDANAAWDFIKWFTSDEIQTQYGQTVEALMGPMGRFDTANVNALENLPWSTAEFRKIYAQFVETVEIPIIPASYAATRHTKNAFRAVTGSDKMMPRYSLMSYNRDINAEITRKNNELATFTYAD